MTTITHSGGTWRSMGTANTPEFGVVDIWPIEEYFTRNPQFTDAQRAAFILANPNGKPEGATPKGWEEIIS